MAYSLSGGGHHGGGHHGGGGHGGGGHHGGGHGGGYGGGWGGYYGGGVIYPNETVVYVVPEETAEEKKIRLAKEKAALKAAGLLTGFSGEDKPFNLVEFITNPTTAIMGVGAAVAVWYFFFRKK